jgi:hypothetical protein
MKMFCPPTDKTCERCQKGAEWGLLAVLAPFVSGGAGIFEISTHGWTSEPESQDDADSEESADLP